MTDTVVERFNAMPWHDSKLIGISNHKSHGYNRVRLSLRLREDVSTLTPVELIFLATSHLKMDVDLEGKRVCSDDISWGRCIVDSPWIRELSAANKYDDFSGLYHFEIGLIPPGGSLNLLAQDFIVERSSQGQD